MFTRLKMGGASRLLTLVLAMTAFGALALVATACGDGEDRPGVEVVGGGSGSQTGTGTGTGTATGGEIGPGVVETKPAGAVEVKAELREWSIGLDPVKVSAGKVYFLADNRGPDDPHELVIIKTDFEPDKLPVVDGRVPEDQVDLIGEIEAFAPKSKASGVFDLEPGKYAIICNIAEVEDGEIESHYELGMRTSFTVE